MPKISIIIKNKSPVNDGSVWYSLLYLSFPLFLAKRGNYFFLSRRKKVEATRSKTSASRVKLLLRSLLSEGRYFRGGGGGGVATFETC